MGGKLVPPMSCIREEDLREGRGQGLMRGRQGLMRGGWDLMKEGGHHAEPCEGRVGPHEGRASGGWDLRVGPHDGKVEAQGEGYF